MNIRDFIPTAAKAVAAFVTPLLAALVAVLVEKTGVDLPFDPSASEAFIASAVTAIAVYVVANRET